MRSKVAYLVVLSTAGVALLVGCGEDAPPLEELPLRDALRADPEVIAAMPDEARGRLADRLEAARTSDAIGDPLDEGGELVLGGVTSGRLIGRIDAARERRGADPLIVGAIEDGVARPLGNGASEDHDPARALPPLPPLEIDASQTSITPSEARALEGATGGVLRALLARSGASRLHRVVGWPIGAVAVGDTAFVNAAWLAALGPHGPSGDADAGAATLAGAAARGAGSWQATAAAPPPAVAPAGSDAGAPASAGVDAGTWPPPGVAAIEPATPGGLGGAGLSPDGGVWQPPPAPPPQPTSVDDSCATACAGSSSSSDSCSGNTDDGSSDSCSGNTDDGSTDACSSSTDDGSTDACSGNTDDGSNCQISRGGRRGRTGGGTTAVLLAPLAFLLRKGRRQNDRSEATGVDPVTPPQTPTGEDRR